MYCIIVDFAEIEECQASGNWDKSAEILSEAAKNLESAGADFIVICTNTMHKVAPQIQNHIHIPILHIAEATAEALIQQNITTVALLGTKYTMTQDFYKERLTASGLSVIIPDEKGVEEVNRIIYNELCMGIISASSRKIYSDIIKQLKAAGAEAVILGCTEIGLASVYRGQHASKRANFAVFYVILSRRTSSTPPSSALKTAKLSPLEVVEPEIPGFAFRLGT